MQRRTRNRNRGFINLGGIDSDFHPMMMFSPRFHHPGIPFVTTLRAYSVAMMAGHDKQNVESGGKIILPPSCLHELSQRNTVYPMLFKLKNISVPRETHCGVLEFVSEEGRCYLPHWMMQNLLLEEGDQINIENVTLPVATFSKFQPQTVDFLDISNPKAILENSLRHFACLTTGDTIAISYNDRIYDFKVLETKPGPAVNIIECDMDVDFAPPVGYVEPTKSSKSVFTDSDLLNSTTYAPVPVKDNSPFGGAGHRLDGKEVSSSSSQQGSTGVASAGHSDSLRNQVRGIPDLDYEPGTLEFIRDLSYFYKRDKVTAEPTFQAFTGKGTTLRATKVKAED